ncbi:MAG: hypothetical protein FJY10_10835 [Bacteroidetes bacterium]|nr:hypothetical protein [Bacteroidota bacterium]
MKLGILRSFTKDDKYTKSYEEACEELGFEYIVLNILSDNWIEEIRNAGVDGILVRVIGNIPEQKQMFDERLRIICKDLKIPIYPSLDELYLYENKRMYSYWLTAHHYPHAPTHVFYTKKDALDYLRGAEFPLVFKTNSGASSSGVEIVRNKFWARLNVHQIFGMFDPRLSLGKVKLGRIGALRFPKFGMAQKHYVIIQDFIPIKWEWRIIKIGNTYSGHQKLLKGNFASGSDRVGWVDPPKTLLHLVKEICEVGQFDSLAMDVLESLDGKFYINELQSLFGSYLPFQMKINDVPGRYQFVDNDFIFQEGIFHGKGSNLLRVEDFVNKIRNGYYEGKRQLKKE